MCHIILSPPPTRIALNRLGHVSFEGNDFSDNLPLILQHKTNEFLTIHNTHAVITHLIDHHSEIVNLIIRQLDS